MPKCMFCGSPVFTVPVCKQHVLQLDEIEKSFEEKGTNLHAIREFLKPDITDSEQMNVAMYLLSFKLDSNRVFIIRDFDFDLILGMYSSEYKLQMAVRDLIKEDPDRTLAYEEWEDGMSEPLKWDWLYIAPDEDAEKLTAGGGTVPDKSNWGKMLFVDGPTLNLKT